MGWNVRFLPCSVLSAITGSIEPLVYTKVIQGIVDGSASQPALRQDTGYMVEKTYYDIAPYLGAFGAYLMPL